MTESNDSIERIHQGTAGAAQDLLVEGMPRCAIYATDDGIWYVTAQLATDEQIALAATPSPSTLCQSAQHTLGLAGIGSRIEPDHTAIAIYAAPFRSPSGESTLVLTGRAVLWSVSRASSETIRALITAAMAAMRPPSPP